jgi:YbgC/YbaW family acyl-CoA thioester hydrolase
MEHQCSLTARSYECDSYGHVNNAVYLNYLEYARLEFMKAAGISYGALRAHGYGLVVVRIQIEYRLPVRADDVLRILTVPLAKQRVKVVFSQRIFRGEEPVAEAEVTWACINSEGRPVRLPPELDVPELQP